MVIVSTELKEWPQILARPALQVRSAWERERINERLTMLEVTVTAGERAVQPA